MRYGKLGSAPSFVGTSRSFSSPDEFGSHRRRRLRVYDPESGSGAGPSSTDEESGLEVEGEDGELVEEDETGLYEEDEEGDEDEMEELEDGRVGDTRRSSGSPGLFPSDPVTSRRGSTETGLALEQSVATIKPSTTGGTAAGTTSDSRASPLLNIFSPTLPSAALPLSTSLATSFGTTSSASSGTPRAPSRRLAPDLTRQISQASVAQRRERERDGYVHRDSDQVRERDISPRARDEEIGPAQATATERTPLLPVRSSGDAAAVSATRRRSSVRSPTRTAAERRSSGATSHRRRRSSVRRLLIHRGESTDGQTVSWMG
jgi:hypothetical protein